MTNKAVVSQQQPPAASTFAALVPAIIGRGHGLRALCFFFAISAELLLDTIVRCGLPTPPDRPYRIYCRASAWTPDQIQQLMTFWPTGAYATVIAERIGRSPTSVRYKAKWLGLPARPRSSLRREISEASLLRLMPAAAIGPISTIEHELADTAVAAPSPTPDDPAPAIAETACCLAEPLDIQPVESAVAAPSPTPDDPAPATAETACSNCASGPVPCSMAPDLALEPADIQAVESFPASVPHDTAQGLAVNTAGSETADIRPSPASVRQEKRGRCVIQHTEESDRLIGDHWLRGVDLEITARMLGLTKRQIECRGGYLGLSGRHFIRGRLKKSFDPNEPHIEPFRSQRWFFWRCLESGRPMWTWANGPRISSATKKTKTYQNKVNSIDEAGCWVS